MVASLVSRRILKNVVPQRLSAAAVFGDVKIIKGRKFPSKKAAANRAGFLFENSAFPLGNPATGNSS